MLKGHISTLDSSQVFANHSMPICGFGLWPWLVDFTINKVAVRLNFKPFVGWDTSTDHPFLHSQLRLNLLNLCHPLVWQQLWLPSGLARPTGRTELRPWPNQRCSYLGSSEQEGIENHSGRR